MCRVWDPRDPRVWGAGCCMHRVLGCRTMAFPCAKARIPLGSALGLPLRALSSLPFAPAAPVSPRWCRHSSGGGSAGLDKGIFSQSFITGCEHRHCCGCALEGGAALRALKSFRMCLRGAGIAPCSLLEGTVCLYNRAVIPVTRTNREFSPNPLSRLQREFLQGIQV